MTKLGDWLIDAALGKSLEVLLLKNLASYREYNNLRISRLLTVMPKRKHAFYHLLPLLLHTNVKGLPGYIEDRTVPYGIEGFNPSESIPAALERIFPHSGLSGQDFSTGGPSTPCIKSLLLMGSLGSIAQNAKSDLDFWVCIYRDKLTGPQLKLLEVKLRSIEQWADEKAHLEVHFFLTDIKMVQNNDFGAAGGESAGSSQARLLKEEFYRTTIHVSGMLPFWWVTPPGSEGDEYDQFKNVARQSKKIPPKTFIDLGNLNEISTEEFFGAAIWQICKALDSPYKSALKIAMLELFLEPVGSSELLCNQLKRRVQSKPVSTGSDLKRLDPYALLFDSILEFYQKAPEIQDLLRTCLYIKSEFDPEQVPEKKQFVTFKSKIMQSYVHSWSWTFAKQKDLSHYKQWEFDRVRELGNRVHQFLIQTYQCMSQRLKKLDSQNQIISPEDTTVIGRKLSSFYRKKAHKIQFMQRAFAKGLWQESITLHPEKPLFRTWNMYRTQLSEQSIQIDTAKTKLLKHCENLTELLVWAILNEVIDLQTSLYLIPSPSPITQMDLQDIVRSTLTAFPQYKISELDNSDLLGSEIITKVLLVANFTSPRRIAEIESLTVIRLSSWGEFYAQSLLGIKSVSELQAYVDLQLEGIKVWNNKTTSIFVPKGPNQRRLESALLHSINQNKQNKAA